MGTNRVDDLDLLKLAAEKFRSGEIVESKSYCDKIIAQDPKNPDALNFLALIARHLKKIAKAEEISKFGIFHNNNHGQLRNTLGMILMDQRRFDEAKENFDVAISIKPTQPEYHSNLARLCHLVGESDLSLYSYNRAIYLQDNFVQALAGRAELYIEKSNFILAEKDLSKAENLAPNDYRVVTVKAVLALAKGRLENSFMLFNLATKFSSDVADARVNRGLIRMLQGRIEEGWADYSMRRKRRWFRATERHRDIPQWNGESLYKKKILFWNEQGLGEGILCMSLIKNIIQHSVEVTVECDKRLAKLFTFSFPSVKFLSEDFLSDHPENCTNYDFQAPIFDLIKRFYFKLNSQNTNSYLYVDQDYISSIREKYIKASSGLPLIGISWASPKAETSRVKKVPISFWHDLFGIKDVAFVNLQYGKNRNDLENMAYKSGSLLIDDQEIDKDGDLYSLAGQILSLDLVITISNTTAHLSGALGQKTWVIVPPLGLGSMWYWGYKEKNSFWYRNLEIRRRTPGDDKEFMKKLAYDLREWVDKNR